MNEDAGILFDYKVVHFGQSNVLKCCLKISMFWKNDNPGRFIKMVLGGEIPATFLNLILILRVVITGPNF